MNNLSVLSVNVGGLNSHEKRNKLFTWLEENKIEMEMYIRNWNGETIHSFSDSSFSRGVSILFSKKCNIDILNVDKSINC